ncbi:ribonuclease III domain-containing protein [Lineolata rhizophorae]|uniref:Large ribosomal subunit protein mL44 n=1 Tax=Lineolata rhizophorae TaxID=578093 RepID=A0A6A6NWP8_9PEZI|nr:ribonuclease III domain-containing protein [Lineolata rhizophorae]
MNLPGSGILVRVSRSAEMDHVIAETATMRLVKMAVLAFQLAGCEYQPPVGDQTCLGYLPRVADSSQGTLHAPSSLQPQSSQRPIGFSPSSSSGRPPPSSPSPDDFAHLPSPPYNVARDSPRLAALHARLSLPTRFPVETLQRCLVDASADPSPDFNNASLALLGGDLLAYHVAEHVLCRYPRLPMAVLFAAQYAYVGPAVLSQLRQEWGVELAAAPGGEVDPGLLVALRVEPGTDLSRRVGTGRPNEEKHNWRRGMPSRIVYDDEFGDLKGRAASLVKSPPPGGSDGASTLPVSEPTPVTVEEASTSFVRAVVGAMYLHCGRISTLRFIYNHVLSRALDFSSLFSFTSPRRDLVRLCDREDFDPPVARLISETGRHSRHPVFVVGIYSGRDKLGEGAGGSLNEARTRAAVAALKGWYLYSPMEVTVPSSVEGSDKDKKWIPNYVDPGEVIV